MTSAAIQPEIVVDQLPSRMLQTITANKLDKDAVKRVLEQLR